MSRWILVGLALCAAACGGEGSGLVDGADTVRSGDAVMRSVAFTEVAAEVGLDFRHGAYRGEPGGDPAVMMAGGICWLDVDRDGWLDLFLTNAWSDGEWGRWRREGGLPTTQLFRNRTGRFSNATDATNAGLEMRATGCVAADLDLDGWTDLYVTSDRANKLLWNEEGTFVEGATQAGVAASGWQSGAAIGDLNGDDWPDLFVAGYADINQAIPGATKGFPNTFQPAPDLLYLNRGPSQNGRVTFEEVGAAAGIERNGLDYGLGALLTDIDADGDLDIYVANDTNPNRLYRNEGGSPDVPVLVEVGTAVGVADDNAGMGVAAGDYDGNGRVDLAVTNLGRQGHVIFAGSAATEDLTFINALEAMGRRDLLRGLTGWGATWADMDLDGDLDLTITHGAIPITDLVADRQPVTLLEYRTDGSGGTFVDSSAKTNLDRVGPYLGRGLAGADYDNDGDTDLAIASIASEVALLRNSGAGGHWLGVDIAPATPGTMVTIIMADGSRQQRELRAGSSYLSSEDPRARFGLGAATAVESVEVVWPDGTSFTTQGVAADQYLAVASGGA